MTTPTQPTGKPWVYIASPYTKGDPAINTRFQCRVFDILLSEGQVIPIAPLWSHFQHLIFPRPYGDWLKYDLEIIQRCDACLRLEATCTTANLDYYESESLGADQEAKVFKEAGKPVFYTLMGLERWAKDRNNHQPNKTQP